MVNSNYRKAKIKQFLLPLWKMAYGAIVWFFYPMNWIFALIYARRYFSNSVLHISHMIHIPYLMRSVLRKQGMKADYMAIGRETTVWDKSDFRVTFSKLPFVRPFQEMFWLWSVVRKYEIIHSHFMLTVTYSGWELPLLKKMGRKIVVHYRGCDIRDRDSNMRMHPDTNVCQECDYFHPAEKKFTCQLERIRLRRELMKKYGDLFLVTTPDLKDFAPWAIHFPFFAPELNGVRASRDARPLAFAKQNKPIKIIHVTNHPGIEGTAQIRQVTDRLKEKGWDINLVFLKGISYERVLQEYLDADLSIGKMKMGFYANAQIESMYFGVPAITYVRPEFMTADLRESGFIFSTLTELEDVLEHYLSHPEQLEAKRSIAKASIARLHDNNRLCAQLIGLYKKLE